MRLFSIHYWALRIWRMWALSTAQSLWTSSTFAILIRFYLLLILSIENDVFCLISNFYVIKLSSTCWDKKSFSSSRCSKLRLVKQLKVFTETNQKQFFICNDEIVWENIAIVFSQWKDKRVQFHAFAKFKSIRHENLNQEWKQRR